MFNSRIGRSYYKEQTGTLPKEDIAIINHLAAEFTDRSKKNIQDWRDALDTADHPETPNWAPLQTMYEYLRPDGHLGSQMDIRRGLSEANRFYIRSRKTGKENEEKTKLLETELALNLIGDLCDSIFFGYTVIQITDPVKGKYDLIDRRKFVPQFNFLRLTLDGDKGIYTEDPVFQGTIIVVKNQYKFGVLNDIVPDLIWKKTARQAWATFSQKFGIPMMTATTNTRDKQTLDRIEMMLKKLGSAAQAIFPHGTTLEVKDTVSKGDPYKIFLEQMNYSDQQISKRLLGGTMVSDNGASKSQSEVHERTMNYVFGEKDRKKTEFAWNKQVIPALRLFGMPFDDDDEFVFDRTEDLTLSQHWAIVKDAVGLGYDVPIDWVSNTFNIPITGFSPRVNNPFSLPDQGGVGGEDAQARARGFFG